MNDTALKILSVFIAVALWVYVYSSENREVSVRVPVTLTGEREGTMASFSPEEVSVRISGPQALVSKATNTLSLTINLSELPAGLNIIKLSRDDIKGSGVETIDIIPNRIEIHIDNTVKKTLPVRPLILDEPPRGYKINSVKVTPPQAEVEGLSAAVAPLTTLQTGNISVANLKTKDNFTVEFLEYDDVKSITPDIAVVTVEVTEDMINRTFENVRITCQAGTSANFAEQPAASVTVYGRRDRIEALSANKLLAPTDCNIIKSPGTHSITPFALPLDNITVTGITPADIETEVLP